MADTALSDQLAIFLRKIGWSVGLERTLTRVGDLVRLYASKGELTPTDWSKLVRIDWELSTDHITDVFAALGYLKRKDKQLLVEPYLDVAAICFLSLQNDREFETANQFVLLNAIIEHDGEIFLNCLKNEFDNDRIRSALTRLVSYKRRVLFDIYRSADFQRRIAHVVNIESQPSNKGGAIAGRTTRLSDERRTEKLKPRSEPLNQAPSTTIAISNDYLRKVPPRRKDWARSIGLADTRGRLTTFGQRLIDEFLSLGCVTPNGDIVLWPFTHEISRMRMNPRIFQQRAIDQWEIIKAIFLARSLPVEDSLPSPHEAAKLVLDFKRQFDIYRKLDRPKSMLRREYPLIVALLANSGIRYARNQKLPPLVEFIEREKKSSRRRIDLRPSRTFLGSMILRD